MQLTSTSPPSTFIGQILDADSLFLPGDPSVAFATPSALSLNPNAYDLESIVIHELGHSFGFNHSGVWDAMMFPFAPAPGQFTGTRPTAQSPDAPLSDDDRNKFANSLHGPERFRGMWALISGHSSCPRIPSPCPFRRRM